MTKAGRGAGVWPGQARAGSGSVAARRGRAQPSFSLHWRSDVAKGFDEGGNSPSQKKSEQKLG